MKNRNGKTGEDFFWIPGYSVWRYLDRSRYSQQRIQKNRSRNEKEKEKREGHRDSVSRDRELYDSTPILWNALGRYEEKTKTFRFFGRTGGLSVCSPKNNPTRDKRTNNTTNYIFPQEHRFIDRLSYNSDNMLALFHRYNYTTETTRRIISYTGHFSQYDQAITRPWILLHFW